MTFNINTHPLSLYTLPELPVESQDVIDEILSDFSNYFVKIAVRSSTSWEHFAKLFCVDASLLKAANTHLSSLSRGSEVFVPVAAESLELGALAMVIPQHATLTSISQMTGLSVEVLAQFNNIENPDLIYAGATLLMPIDTEAHPEISLAQNWQILLDDPELQSRLMPMSQSIAQTLQNNPASLSALKTAVENGEDPMTVMITHNGQKMSFADFVIEFFGKALPRGFSKLWEDICANPEILLLVISIVVLAVLVLPASATTAIFWATLVLTFGFLGLTTFEGYDAWQNGDTQALEDASTEFGVTAISLLFMAPAAKASYPAVKATLATLNETRSITTAWSTFSQMTSTAGGAAGLVEKLKQVPGTIAHSPDEIAAFSPVLKKLLALEVQTAQNTSDNSTTPTQFQLAHGQIYQTLYGDQPNDDHDLWQAIASLRKEQSLLGDGDCCYMKISSGKPNVGDPVTQWVPSVADEFKIDKIFPVPGYAGHYIFTITKA